LNMLGSHKRLPKINFLFILFVVTILQNYKIPLPFGYIFMGLAFLAILKNVIPNITINNSDIKLKKEAILVILASFVLLIGNSVLLGSIKYGLILYFPFYLTVFLTLIMILKHGINYIYQFLRQFLYTLNILSVINLYQVIFHKPILLNFLIEKYYNFQLSAIGTTEFRTISVFGHPIVCGLFFTVAFVFNFFILQKGKPTFYIIQSILLVNIYSTHSRSAWLSLVITTLIMLIIQKPKLNFVGIALKKKNLLFYYLAFCVSIVVFVVFMANFTDIKNEIIVRFGDSLSSNSKDLSNLQRTGTIKLILNNFSHSDFINQLFGNGVGMSAYFMRHHTVAIQNFLTTDNQYLTWLYEFGLFGLLVISILLCLLFLNSIRRNKSPYQKATYYSVVVLLIEMFFFDAMGDWTDLKLFLGISVILLSVRGKSELRETEG